MNEKKILVYDSSGAFSRFIKLKYAKAYQVDNFNKFFNAQEVNFWEYDIAFFIINHEIEAVDFIRIYNKVPVLFVGSSIPEVHKKIVGLHDTILLDLQNIKSQILESIDFYLNVFEGRPI